MEGKNIRMGKLFSNGKPVIVAVDHGSYQGPLRGIEDLPGAIQNFSSADGVLVMPGMAKHVQSFFSTRTSPSMIVRVNWGSHYCPGFTQGIGDRFITVREAVRLGADAVICSLLFGGSEEANTRNITVLGEVFTETKDLGIPLIGEYIPLGGIDRYRGDTASLAMGVRALVEFGVDLIKTVFIDDFEYITRISPVPVFALGGAKTDKTLEAFEIAQQAVMKGAAGVVFGRNVFQAENPVRFLEALCRVVKENLEAREADAWYHENH